MTELQRILDSSEPDQFEYRLLRGAARECPSPESVVALRAGLGLKATAWTRIAALSGWKLTLLSVAFSAFLGLRGTQPSGAVGSTRSAAAERASDVRHQASVPQVADTRTAAVQTPPESTAQAAPVRENGVAAVDSSRARTIERPHASVGPDLREEIRLLDAARSALQSHQPRAAMEAIDTYNARFPAGAFKQEAAMLKIQALALRGETSRANSMAKKFIKNNPDSPYVNRASRIVEQSGGAMP